MNRDEVTAILERILGPELINDPVALAYVGFIAGYIEHRRMELTSSHLFSVHLVYDVGGSTMNIEHEKWKTAIGLFTGKDTLSDLFERKQREISSVVEKTLNDKPATKLWYLYHLVDHLDHMADADDWSKEEERNPDPARDGNKPWRAAVKALAGDDAFLEWFSRRKERFSSIADEFDEHAEPPWQTLKPPHTPS